MISQIFVKKCVKKRLKCDWKCDKINVIILKLILFADVIKPSFIHPAFFNRYPATITINTGTVAFKLYIKLSIA